MSRIALCTGAGTGIGRAIAVRLNAQGMKVIICGRRLDKLKETQSLCSKPDSIVLVCADVSSEAGRREITRAAEASCAQAPLDYLIHNAGIVGPLKPTASLTLDEFRASMATNVEGPLFLSRDLLPLLSKGRKGRVLHVSSGCAHKPEANWLTYCTTKAALLMVYQCQNTEWGSKGVVVGSFKPGIVDTEMQQEMRKASLEDFPKVEFFKRLKTGHDEWTSAARSSSAEELVRPHRPDRSRLDSPENAAWFAYWLLERTSDDEFKSKDWDIRLEEAWLSQVEGE